MYCQVAKLQSAKVWLYFERHEATVAVLVESRLKTSDRADITNKAKATTLKVMKMNFIAEDVCGGGWEGAQ